MTKADLYKRRSKNKQRKSSGSDPRTSTEQMETDDSKEASLIETINNLKNRMNKNSIDNDVELIKANTIDTPIEQPEPTYTEEEEIPSVKPVEKTYAKSRSKLDDYIYIESSQGLDETEVAFPKTSRTKKSEESPVPRKRRKVENKETKVNGERELRSKDKKAKSPKVEKRVLRKKSVDKDKKTRTTKESIENEKAVVTRVTRKRKYEELTKPVLREKGQNRSSKTEAKEVTRKIARPKKAAKKPQLEPLKIDVDQNVRMTRSRQRRIEISLSPSQVKNIVPAFSFESERRVNSMESNRSNKSNKTKGKASNTKKTASKAKKTPVRSLRTRAARR